MPQRLLPSTSVRLREQLSRSVFGFGAIVAAASVGGAAVQASCSPSNQGTAGADNIVCTAPGANPLIVNGSGGDDVITNNGETITTLITGAAGNDTLSQTAGTANTGIFGSSGEDTILLSGGSVFVGLGGGDDDDLIILSGGELDGFAAGGQGDDAITIAGGSGTYIVTGSSGQDTLEVSGGSVDLGVFGGDDRDTITISGGNIDVGVAGDGGDDLILMSDGDVDVVNGGSGDDTVTITGGTIDGLLLLGVVGGDGSDTLSIGGDALVNGLITGGSGDDSLELAGDAVANLGIVGNTGNDLIVISGGTVEVGVSGDGALGPSGSDGDDAILMSGGEVNGALAGYNGNDTFDLSGGTIAGGGGFAVDAGDGADTIAISGTAQIDDTVSGRSGADSIVMSGGTVDSSIVGEGGDDYMALTGGVVTGDIFGNSGADTLTLGGATLAGTLGGDTGNDTLFVSGGNGTAALGGLGGDTLVASGGTIDTLSGDEGDDLITLDGMASIAGVVLGGSGADSLDLVDAASVTGTINAGSGDDTVIVRDFFFTLSAVDLLDGGAGADSITFRQMVGQLGSGFEGFETIVLDNAGLNVFDGSNDTRTIQGDGGSPVAIGLMVGSGLFARGNSPGVLNIVGSLGNDVSALDMQDGAADDRVNISQDYAGANGAQLRIDAALDATNAADLLDIDGSITSVNVGATLFVDGTTLLVVNDVGSGVGILTGTGPGHGIPVVDVSNTGNTDPSDFALIDGPLQAGAVQYDLVLETDGIWYLQSRLLNQVFGYATAPSAALGMGQDYLGSLRQRVGTREQSWTGGATQSSDGGGVWLRGGGSSTQVSDAKGFDYDQDHWFAQAGADLPLLVDPASGRLIGGLFAQYGTSNVDAFDASGATAAKAKLDAWGGGLSLTWYGSPEGAAGNGFYADLLSQVSFYDADFKTTGSGETGSTDGWGWGVSLEAGWGFTVADEVRLIPQAQLTYSRVSLNDFTDRDGVEVDFGSAESLQGRVGLAVDSGKLWRSGNLTFTASLLHEFLGETQVTVSGIDSDSDQGGTAASLGLGGTVSLLDNVSLYADVDYRIPFDQGRESVQAQAGIRLSW